MSDNENKICRYVISQITKYVVLSSAKKAKYVGLSSAKKTKYFGLSSDKKTKYIVLSCAKNKICSSVMYQKQYV